jgi:predicted nucleotidyltransferase
MGAMLTAGDAEGLAERVLRERYPLANAALAAGSLVRGGATATSDLDLVVLFSELPNAYRESFVFEGVPVDAFVHDPETLRAFFGKDVDAGKSAMLTMTAEGRIVGPRPECAKAMKSEAEAVLAKGPPSLDKATLDLFRYLITSRIEDLQDQRPWPEALATGAWLHLALADFILRANGRWAATGKWIPRALAAFDPALAAGFHAAFADLFDRRDAGPLISFAEQALAPFGGRLFEGFRAEAKAEDRIASPPSHDAEPGR